MHRNDFSKKGRGGQAQAEETSMSKGPEAGWYVGRIKNRPKRQECQEPAGDEQGRGLEPDQGGFHGPC